MSIVSEIKCARCDRKYSGIRSRCPYCGARRIGRGKYSEEPDNTKGKMLISVLIMSVLVVAAGVLLFTQSVDADDSLGEPYVDDPPSAGLNITEGDNTILGGDNPHQPPPPSPTPTPSPTPQPEIRSVRITFAGSVTEDFTMNVGDRLALRVRVDPPDLDKEITWRSTDTSVFEVVPDGTDGISATVTGIGAGRARVFVTVGDVEAECIVRVAARR